MIVRAAKKGATRIELPDPIGERAVLCSGGTVLGREYARRSAEISGSFEPSDFDEARESSLAAGRISVRSMAQPCASPSRLERTLSSVSPRSEAIATAHEGAGLASRGDRHPR
jgi:hypothetical protein